MTYSDEYLNETEILNCFRILGNTDKFFKNLYDILSNCSKESEKYLLELEQRRFKNISEIIKYYE